MLPTDSDLQHVQAVIEEEMADARKKLHDEPNIRHYAKLAEVSLTSLVWFNRRRPGETSRLTVKDFHLRSSGANEDAAQHLSGLEKKLCR